MQIRTSYSATNLSRLSKASELRVGRDVLDACPLGKLEDLTVGLMVRGEPGHSVSIELDVGPFEQTEGLLQFGAASSQGQMFSIELGVVNTKALHMTHGIQQIEVSQGVALNTNGPAAKAILADGRQRLVGHEAQSSQVAPAAAAAERASIRRRAWEKRVWDTGAMDNSGNVIGEVEIAGLNHRKL